MIIDLNHPYADEIKVYGMSGNILGMVIIVDTDAMEAERVVDVDVTGYPVIITVPVSKIEGPGIYFVRKLSKGRMVNAGKIKARR